MADSKDTKKQRSAYGGGTIYKNNKTKEGGYYGQIRIDGVRHTVKGKTKKDVQKQFDDLKNPVVQEQKKADLRKLEMQEKGAITMHDWLDVYFERWKKRKIKSHKSIQCVMNRIKRMEIASYSLKDISSDVVIDFLNEMLDKKYALRTQEYTFVVLNEALNCAVGGQIEKNPCNNPNIEKPRSVIQRKKKYWTKEEVFLFTEKCCDHHLFNMFYLMLTTGLRKQEACALKWSDVNWKEKTIMIDKAIVDYTGTEELGDTKRETSVGEVTLIDETVEILKRQKRFQNEQMLKYKFRNEENFVFTSIFGKHYSLSWPTQEFKRICKEAGLPLITLHGLRHTHATLLFEAGTPIEDVRDRLRHSSSQITSLYYKHKTKEGLKRPLPIISDVFTKKKDENKDKEKDKA